MSNDLKSMGRRAKEYKCPYCTYDVKISDPNTSNKTSKLKTHMKSCPSRTPPPQAASVYNTTINIVILAPNILQHIPKKDVKAILDPPEDSITTYIPHLLWFNRDFMQHALFATDSITGKVTLRPDIDSANLLQLSCTHGKELVDLLGEELSNGLRIAWAEYARVINAKLDKPVKVSDFWPGGAHMPCDICTIDYARMCKEIEMEVSQRLAEVTHNGAMSTRDIVHFCV